MPSWWRCTATPTRRVLRASIGRVHFAPWHRLYMLRMEKALQDSHEELYGNRSIAVHYWDWGDSSKDHVFDPSLWSEQSSFGSVERMQGLFGGTRPLDQVALDGSGRIGRGSDRYNAQILYDDGYSPLPDSEMLADRRWLSIRSDYHAYLFRASRMRHDFAARLMEPFHNSSRADSPWGHKTFPLTTSTFSCITPISIDCGSTFFKSGSASMAVAQWSRRRRWHPEVRERTPIMYSWRPF